MAHCIICEKSDKGRNLVCVLWDQCERDGELYTDYWRGMAHASCIEDHNENSGKPTYYIASREYDLRPD